MSELYIKYKQKVSWKNDFEWTYSDDVFKVVEDEDGLYVLNKFSGQQGWCDKNVFDIGKRYKVSYELDEDQENQFVGGIVFVINGNTTYVANSVGTHDFITEEITNVNMKFRAYSFNNNWNLKNLKIECLTYDKLDLIEDFDIKLRFKVSDVRDYSERDGLISTGFKLPGSSNNNRLLKYIYELNQENKINIYDDLSAMVNLGDTKHITGKLFITNIEVYNGFVEYEVYFTGNNINLFKDIGEDELETLAPIMSEFRHLGLNANMYYSWEHDTSYKYGYIDYGMNKNGGGVIGYVGGATDELPSVGLTMTDFKPQIQLKYVFDKIFEKYDYTYSSTLFDEDWFSDIFIPYTNPKEKLNRWVLNSKVRFGGLSFKFDDSIQLTETSDDDGRFVQDYVYDTRKDGILSYRNLDDNIIYLTSDKELYRLFNYGPYMTSNETSTLQGFPDQENPNDYQVNSNHLPSTYLCKRAGRYKMKMLYTVPSAGDQSDINNQPIFVYACKMNQSAVKTEDDYQFSIVEDSEVCVQKIFHQYPISSQLVEHEFDCDEGDLIYFKVYKKQGGSYNFDIDYVEIWEDSFGSQEEWVDASDVLPENIKIKDFFDSVVQMFNLYIDVDPDDENNLIIETRDTFYELGNILDWSHLFDTEGSEISPTSLYQNRINKLKYADGDDYHNEMYIDKKNIQEVGYGGKRFIVDNDIAEGESSIDLLFAPTILRDTWRTKGATQMNQFVLSTIWNAEYPTTSYIQIDEKYDWKPRILFYKYIDIYDNDFSDPDDKTYFNVAGARTTKYPYIGHIQDPFDLEGGVLDLNFETRLRSKNVWQKMFGGYPTTSITNENLYNKYYLNQINEYTDKDSRVLKCEMFLSPSDIAEMNMNDTILIDSTYYHINSIEYNIINSSLSTCEFVKVLSNPDIEYVEFDDDDGGVFPRPPIDGTFGINIGRNISTNTLNSIVIGDNNVFGDNSIIFGSNNKTTNNSIIIGGENVSSKGENNVIINSKNISTDVSDVTLINSSVNSSELNSGDIVIGNVSITDGLVIQQGGIVDEGLDVVYDPFGVGNYIYTDCGENDFELDDINLNIIEDGGLD